MLTNPYKYLLDLYECLVINKYCLQLLMNMFKTMGHKKIQRSGTDRIIYHISRGTKVAYRAKTHIFAPERYTAGILYTDSLNSA